MRYLLVILLLGAVAVIALSRGDDPPAPASPRESQVKVEQRVEKAPDVRRARCPDGVPGCRAVRGTVVFVERVDPDGDGDLHVVVDAGGITLPGMTAIDVAPELRPRRDPRIGDRVSAAGPVQPGSFGQKQIHALVFRTQG